MGQVRAALLGLVALLSLVATAHGQTIAFVAELTGKLDPTNTGSTATGHAHIRVDLSQQWVSLDLVVKGITRDQLSDQLVAAPIGPIHLHQYGSHDHSGDKVELVYPLPYGPAYRTTKSGFTVTLRKIAYNKGAALLAGGS
jgi:hypothetical protein